MTPQELIDRCEWCVKKDLPLSVSTYGQTQPIPGFRGELLCVNQAGIHTYRYTPRQAGRISKMVSGHLEAGK